jgi:hypothetical protein
MKHKITRRDFIKASLGTAASLSLPHLGLPELLAQTLELEKTIPDLAVVTDGDPASLTRKAVELIGGSSPTSAGIEILSRRQTPTRRWWLRW